ncbi:hypothetical protein [Parafrankia sp. BMG5.11]|uniref:hypothetical protein n=1 Tax=Parafrankia sp. BMG5.11 TaxID=222540 RepID=UPI001038BF73|nr:hypothetical protein [Parafrankia sp. BMG5.11]TCJ38172.1 hypothetical protein E0504_14425 [Parafrankia sp. BMG5.11]
MTPRLIIGASAIALLASAPVTAQNTGAEMTTEARHTTERAESQSHLAKDWKKGEKMTVEGRKLMARSQDRVASYSRTASRHQARADRATADARKAAASLAEGRRMVAAGARLKGEAEFQFPLVPGA